MSFQNTQRTQPSLRTPHVRRVLITGGRAPVALDLARQFAVALLAACPGSEHPAGVIAPETWRLESRDDLARLELPSTQFVFKPVFSRFTAYTLVCPQPAALAGLNPTPVRPWLAQRFVSGRERCSYLVTAKGQIRAHAVYEPRWRVRPRLQLLLRACGGCPGRRRNPHAVSSRA